MGVFTYQAMDPTAGELSGTIAADSPREAREKLRAQGLLVESLSEQTSKRSGSWQLFDRPSRYAGQLATAIRDLTTLLGTGIGLVEALDTVAAQFRGRFQTSLMGLRQQVASGTSLSEAMQAEPTVYDDLTIHMIRVGENAGTLDTVLEQLAEFRERYLLYKDRITTALMYPAIVIMLAIGVSIFLMTVVLPMLLENLADSGRPLPLPTRVVSWLSDLVVHHGGLICIAAVVGAITATICFRTKTGKRLWHGVLLALPVLGPLAKKQEIARVALIISTLMKNGIVFVEATQIAARATKNMLLRDALQAMRERVQSGGEIGEALAGTRIFPAMVVQIFTVGQQTGSMEEMLDRLAVSYERQVSSATARLTAALEPVLIVFLAIVVGFILFATILPILEAGNVL